MASIESVTIGSYTYTAYSSVLIADEFLAADPIVGPVWALLADEDAKGPHIVSATRLLDSLIWRGVMTELDQLNQWPRSSTGISSVIDDEIPDPIQWATNILAGLSATGVDILNFTTTANLQKRIKAGSVEVENFKGEAATYPYPLPVWRLISPYLRGSDSSAAISGFGLDGCSITLRDYHHNSGF